MFVYVCMIKSVYPKIDFAAESLFLGGRELEEGFDFLQKSIINPALSVELQV